ncbi:MAG: extracellular solute-binding protein [Nitrososphaerales archaeon]|jgi:molybdate/tungstate transport system substrate-binding protein
MTRENRSGISAAAGIAAVVVVIVLALAAFEVVTVSGKTTTTTVTLPTTTTDTLTTTVTSPSTATVTSTTTSLGSVTTTLTTTSVGSTTTTLTTTSVALAPLISYSADAYATETTALLSGFSKSTGVPVAPVISGGSNADASSIEAGAPDDVFISASLSATAPAHLGTLSSNWAIGFAADQMVLAYSNATLTNSGASAIVAQAQTAAKSNATSDWNAFFTALTSGSTKVGISSPVADPAGLRAWLVLEAAGYLYAGGNQQAYASPLLKSGDNVTASSAASLVAPLQSGQIQFLFIYRSAAITDGLGYLSLNSHVNLSSSSLASFYSQFSYKDSAGTTAGAPIVLCLTIPNSSVNSVEALQFVQYVVKNAASLSSDGLVIPTPLLLYDSVASPQTLPAAIQALLAQGTLVAAGPI